MLNAMSNRFMSLTLYHIHAAGAPAAARFSIR